MPYKDPEKQRAAERRWHAAHREQVAAKQAQRRAAARATVQFVKENTPCTDCGIHYPYYVMDFDHLGDKDAEIHVLMGNGQKAKMLTEIEKCEVVCSNCHRIRTHQRAVAQR